MEVGRLGEMGRDDRGAWGRGGVKRGEGLRVWGDGRKVDTGRE